MSVEKAILGKEAKSFLKSKVGQYVVERAEAERRKSIVAFQKADLTNLGELQKMQIDMITSSKVINWLLDVVSEGQACEYELNKTALSSDMPH